MGTRLEQLDYMAHMGMDKKSSKMQMQDTRLRLAQNCTYRERGALTKRNGYTQISNSQPQS